MLGSLGGGLLIVLGLLLVLVLLVGRKVLLEVGRLQIIDHY